MSRRLRHYIKANSNTEIPSQAIWFDTETKPTTRPDGAEEHSLWFGYACYRRSRAQGDWCSPRWLRFSTPLEFWSWVGSLLRPKTTTYLFCHNTNFDLPVLKAFSLPTKMGWQLIRAVIDGPPTIIVYKHNFASVKILDTLNFWRVPLKELGKDIGLPKLDMPKQTASPKLWEAYGRRDVEIIMKACLDWWGFLIAHDFGGFAPTLAGQAMRTWRHRYMVNRVLIDDNQLALTLSRSAYLGGRNECFAHGRFEGPIYYLDINSMYPSVMKRRPYPCQLVGFDRRRPEATFAKYSETHATVGRVKLSVQESLYPRVIDKRLCFPIGTFWADLAGPELMHAVEEGHVVGWESVAIYEQAELFTGFIDDLYNIRLGYKRADNKVYAYFIKIMMNSLYGKFGQRGMVWEESSRTEDESSKAWVEYDVVTGRIKHCRQLAGLVQTKCEDGEARESFPAIAAYVTSYARLSLANLIGRVGMENTLYCDTDGLFVIEEGYHRVRGSLSDEYLCAPKLEHTAPYVILLGLKDYDLGGRVKVKGVRRTAHWLSETEVLQEQWSGLKGQLSRGDLDNATTRKVKKTLSREYRKGRFLRSGRVAPIVLDE